MWEDRYAGWNEPAPSIQDQVREWVRAVGADCPDQEWILSDFDTWERNPHYKGPRGPLPDDRDCMTPDEQLHDDMLRAKRMCMAAIPPKPFVDESVNHPYKECEPEDWPDDLPF